MRSKIWYTLIDNKTNEFYTDLVLRRYQIFDLAIRLFLGIFSSGSIVAWSIWNRIPTTWAIFVGLFQILFIISPIVGFPKYIKTFDTMNLKLKDITNELEELWWNYERDKISDDLASGILLNLRKQISKIEDNSSDIIFFDNKKLLRKAERKIDTYLIKI